MVRGRLEAPREIVPRQVVVGDTLFYNKDGKWFHRGTNTECEVESWDLGVNLQRKEDRRMPIDVFLGKGFAFCIVFFWVLAAPIVLGAFCYLIGWPE